jgi:hypothetical protein
MVSIYTKDFPWEKRDPNSSDFELKNYKWPESYDKLQMVAKSRDGFVYFFGLTFKSKI